MKTSSFVSALVTASQHIGNSKESLMAIRNIGVNMAIWQRPANPKCLAVIDALLFAPCAVALDLNPAEKETISTGIHSLVSGRCDPASASALADEIWALVGLFCSIADTNHARVRLERIEDDGCMLFHADTLRLRMLCTYAGPGTEWLDSDNARYDQLGLRGRSIEETNRAIVVDEAKIRHLAPWHVAVFSGRLREDTLPLIHRSAPVRSEKDHRIRLCIDLPGTCGC
jgi:hypothetical protein